MQLMMKIRAARYLVEWPDDLSALIGQLDELGRLKTKKTQAATDRLRTPAELLASGDADSPAQAQTAAEKATTDQERAAEELAVVEKAADLVARKLERWVHDRPDDLIEGPIRDAMADLIDRLSPMAETLEDFAPAYDPKDIIGSAEPDQLAAWRESREAQNDFDLIRDVWHQIFLDSCDTARGGPAKRRWMKPRRPGGIFGWEDPLGIPHLPTRDGRGDVLAIAHYPGFRLASPREVEAISRQIRLVHPLRSRKGTNNYRQVPGVLEPKQ
jgi:hypothetical protein